LAAGCHFDPGVLIPQDLAMPDDAAFDLTSSPTDSSPDAAPDLLSQDLLIVPTLDATRADFAASVSLTNEGTVDWTHFGLTTASDVNRKSGPMSIAVTMQGTVARFASYAPMFNWTDGTPTTSATTHAGVYVTGQGNGYTITAPTGTTLRTMRVYVSQNNATSAFVAHLSDGSVADVMIPHSVGVTDATQVYTVNFRTAAPATLTVTFTNANPPGDVDLLAVTIQ
jgi:hypothetical protein